MYKHRLHQLLFAIIFTAACQGRFAHANCRDELRRIPLNFSQIMTFDANPFYNGGLLLEFFGPTQNTFRSWLSWLEGNGNESPPFGPGLYHGNTDFVVAKDMEFPIDAGVDQFPRGDTRARRIIPLMSFAYADITIMRGDSPRAKDARQSFLSQLDLHLFGIYGSLGRSTRDSLTMLSIAGDQTLAASIYPRIRYTATPSWAGFGNPDSARLGNPLDDFNHVAEVIEADNAAVLVRIKLGPKNPPRNRNEEIIQKMFFITHWQMVQKAYRETGLFVDSLDTALYLLDDFVASMQESGGSQDLYLLYDTAAWQSMLFRMNVAHQYVAIDMRGAGLQPFHYQTISDVFYPFYPIYGMIVADHGPKVVEFKRLFHNANPDPLKLLGVFSEPKHLSLQFYHRVAGELPADQTILAVSKSRRHTRFYQSLGFHLDSSEFNRQWNSNQDTLTVTRDLFLERTKPRAPSPQPDGH